MRSTFFQTLALIALIVTCFSAFAFADDNVKKMNWDHRRLQDDKTTTFKVDQPIDEEERFFSFPRLRKFKNYVRGNTKSVATLQKNPTVIKEVEKFTSNAAVINEIKGNPTTIKRLESLGKQPAIVESLQKAPVETSVKRVQTYLSRSESNLVSEKTKWVVFFLSFFVIFGGVIGLITLLEKLVGPGVD